MIIVLLGLDIVGNTLCWIRMNIFCVSSRQNGPLDSSEYEFLNITICFHWCRTQKQSLTPAWYSLFVRSFVFFLIAALISAQLAFGSFILLALQKADVLPHMPIISATKKNIYTIRWHLPPIKFHMRRYGRGRIKTIYVCDVPIPICNISV